MLYIRLAAAPQGASETAPFEGLVVAEIATDRKAFKAIASPTGGEWARQPNRTTFQPGWLNRNDLDTFEQATELARLCSIHAGKPYLPTDATASTSPRYDVIEAPQVGDLVSKSFNGDSYPCGKIVAISESLRRVKTDTGVVFFRRGATGGWKSNGTWWMTSGHTDERNPSF